MSQKIYTETRTWIVTGIADHTIRVEWDRRKWTPPASVVKVDDEIVSRSTFWSRQFYYGAHVLRLKDVSDHPVILKYHEKSGYVLFIDGRQVSPVDEQIDAPGSVWGPLDTHASPTPSERELVAAAAG